MDDNKAGLASGEHPLKDDLIESLLGEVNELSVVKQQQRLRIESLEAELEKERAWGNQSFIAIVTGCALIVAALFLNHMGVLP